MEQLKNELLATKEILATTKEELNTSQASIDHARRQITLFSTVQRANSKRGCELKMLMSVVIRQVQAENLDSTKTMDKFIFGLTGKKKYHKFIS